MTLREEFEHTGNWFFRWRSYLPLTVIIFYLLALSDYEYLANNKQTENLWRVICLVVSFTGLFIRIFTIGYLPEGTSGRNTKEQIAETLNTKGMYSVVRNPLYLGNFFMVLGVTLFVHIWWLTIIYILIFLLYYERIIIAEEAYLEKKCSNCDADFTHILEPETPPLVLDFLDRDSRNGKQENLRVLCLNCVYELRAKHRGWYRHREIPINSVIDDQLPPKIEIKDESLEFIPFENFQKTLNSEEIA